MNSYSGPAAAYARAELGMADDEPNEATRVETFTRYSLIAAAFDAGMDVGDYFEGWNEGNRAASANPRVVSTVAELDALPHGTVLHGAQGQAYLILSAGIFGAGHSLPLPKFAVGLPATVLWVGGTE